ncbi:MAG: ABC transporter permease [Lachnospiraceae bacterium]|nr:ABC transporter permease [Lachnospiraceae bacterium]MBQ6362643.1 ABC transporter permease [Lachnospiraceae bacterium]MBR2996145.1 ABC transporter permease [Lachnospiraceae bacterium]
MGAVASYFASLSLPGLFARIPAGVAQGLVWGLMALGVYITFRLLDIADLSVDGTFSTGSAVVVMLILSGVNPWAATLIAMAAGLVAGTVTGLLHTKLGIPAILSGILTQYALYSINLAIMGFKANQAVSVDKYALIISSRTIPKAILTGVLFSAAIIALLYWFFGTELGSSIRATGCNQQMAKAQGININSMKVLGLAISNGLVAMAGALSAQYSGFADVNSGRGAIVIGLAAVIIGEVIGEALLGKHLNFAGRLAFVVIGGILYYIVYTVVLWLKLDSNLMKLFTAVIVAIFLAVPYLRGQSKSSFRRAGKDAAASAVEAYDRDPYAWDKPQNTDNAQSAGETDAADKGVK